MKTRVLFACVLVCLIGSSLLQRYVGNIMKSPNCDFYDYYFAAQVVHENPHGDLYYGAMTTNPQLGNPPSDSSLYRHGLAAGFDDIGMYIYPPLLADLLVPVSTFPPHIAALLWRGLNLSLVLVSVVILGQMLGIPIVSSQFLVLVVAAYSFWPIHEAISLGQITIVMLALWAGGVSAYFNRNVVLSAACFALATALKVTPILLLPLFVLWGDRKWLLSYAAVLLGLIAGMSAVNGFHMIASYRLVMSAMGTGAPAYPNKTLGALAVWSYYGRIFTFETGRRILADEPRALLLSMKALSGLFYAFCLALVWRSRKKLADSRSRAATIAVFALVTALSSPVSWRHAYTIALIVLAILWWRALVTDRSRTVHRVLLALTGTPPNCRFRRRGWRVDEFRELTWPDPIAGRPGGWTRRLPRSLWRRGR